METTKRGGGGEEEEMMMNVDDDEQRQQRQPATTAVDDDLTLVDDTPAFLRPEDAVEVQVDDDNEPMDEEEDESVLLAMQEEREQIIPDMSRAKIESHGGPVYAVASCLVVAASCNPTTTTTGKDSMLAVVSGGGDDRAFLHRVSASSSSVAAGGGVVVETKAMEFAHTDSVSCVALNIPYVDASVTTPANNKNVNKTPQKLAAVGGYDGAVVVYDFDTGELVHTFEGPSDVEWLQFHPKGGTVLLAGSSTDGTIWMYHVPLRKCLQVFVGHESAVSAGAFSPDGRVALSAGADGTLRVWAPRTGASKHVFRFDKNAASDGAADVAGLTCMDTDGGTDGQLIIVGAEDGRAHVCHAGAKKVVASLQHYTVPQRQQQQRSGHNDDDEALELPMSVEAVGFAPRNVAGQQQHAGWCATGGVDGVLNIWDLTNNGQLRQACRVTSNDENDETTTTTTTTTKGSAATTTATPTTVGGITRLRWHPSLPLVFCGYTTGRIRLWDARNGRLLHTLTGHSDCINDLNVVVVVQRQKGDNQPTNAIVVSAGDDNTVRVFEVDIAQIWQKALTAAPAATTTTGPQGGQ